MIEARTVSAKASFEGRMFLYEQPELLTKEDHGGLGLAPVARPYDFVRAVRAVPLVALEFRPAQRDYPVVFSDTEIPSPLAVLGVMDDVNLFVDENGNWIRPHYIPSYLRCHPIALAQAPNEQTVVLIDRAAATISEQPEEPFFEDASVTDRIRARIEFCARYNQERQRTVRFCTRLKELGLFAGQRVMLQPPGGEKQSAGTYVAIDVEKVGKLDNDTLRELHDDGSLAAIYAHVFSLENWSRLLDLRMERLVAKAAEIDQNPKL